MYLTKGEIFMKNDLVWAKTILSVYRYLERICDAIDNIVMQSALGSFNIVGQEYSCNNVYSISQKIIDYSQRKITLINLKILIEDILQELSPSDAKVLIERYVEGAKRREMAEKFEVGLRTVYRKIDHAEQAFVKKMRLKGYGAFSIEEFLKNELWIKNAYLNIEDKGEEDFQISGVNLKKAVSM